MREYMKLEKVNIASGYPEEELPWFYLVEGHGVVKDVVPYVNDSGQVVDVQFRMCNDNNIELTMAIRPMKIRTILTEAATAGFNMSAHSLKGMSYRMFISDDYQNKSMTGEPTIYPSFIRNPRIKFVKENDKIIMLIFFEPNDIVY